jgi:hypothetical protein
MKVLSVKFCRASKIQEKVLFMFFFVFSWATFYCFIFFIWIKVSARNFFKSLIRKPNPLQSQIFFIRIHTCVSSCKTPNPNHFVDNCQNIFFYLYNTLRLNIIFFGWIYYALNHNQREHICLHAVMFCLLNVCSIITINPYCQMWMRMDVMLRIQNINVVS